MERAAQWEVCIILCACGPGITALISSSYPSILSLLASLPHSSLLFPEYFSFPYPSTFCCYKMQQKVFTRCSLYLQPFRPKNHKKHKKEVSVLYNLPRSRYSAIAHKIAENTCGEDDYKR